MPNENFGWAKQQLLTDDNLMNVIDISDLKIELIAKVCHDVNRAYCKSVGDDSQVSWEDAPD